MQDLDELAKFCCECLCGIKREQNYFALCQQILPEVQQDKILYHNRLRQVLHPMINCLVGSELSEIVTGMITGLPSNDLKLALQDWSVLTSYVERASQLVFEQALRNATNQNSNDWTLFISLQVKVSYATE